MVNPLLPLFALLLLSSCADGPPSTPETRAVENPNAGNTAIYDVDPEDPYEIDHNSFLEMAPGEPLAPFLNHLSKGKLATSAGTIEVYFILGRRDDTLGYLVPRNKSIERIVVISPDVVTKQGIRTGVSYRELVQRLGELPPGDIGPEGDPVVTKDDLTYRFSRHATAGKIAADSPITAIILQ